MTKTDILTATESYGKAKSAFGLALSDAAAQREAAMYALGGNYTTQAGKVLTPEEAGQVANVGGETLKSATLSTGFGDRGIATIAKTGVDATAAAVTGLQEQGISTESGLSQQARTVSRDQSALATQEAIQQSEATIAGINADQTTAFGTERAAAEDYNTALGRKMVNPKPVTGKDLNIWGGKVHNAAGKVVRDATKKEVAKVKANAKGKK